MDEMNKYLFNIYKILTLKLDQYLSHISIFIDWDEEKLIFSNNTMFISNSHKYGIYFEKPNTITDLFSGKVGEMTEDFVSAYYGLAVGCDCSIILQYINFVLFNILIFCV